MICNTHKRKEKKYIKPGHHLKQEKKMCSCLSLVLVVYQFDETSTADRAVSVSSWECVRSIGFNFFKE